MSGDLTEAGRRWISDLSARYNLSQGAVETMARAVANGGGTMAQFDIPELGGSGQWMSGGMTMVGDMFNYGLQSTVSGLCVELSNAMANDLFFIQPKALSGGAGWWPSDLGAPSSTGGQNQMRYAYFPDARRLAVDPGDGSPIRVLDTLDHHIGGFSQQQSGPSDPFIGLTFSSQYGMFAVASLPPAPGAGGGMQAPSVALSAETPQQIQAPGLAGGNYAQGGSQGQHQGGGFQSQSQGGYAPQPQFEPAPIQQAPVEPAPTAPAPIEPMNQPVAQPAVDAPASPMAPDAPADAGAILDTISRLAALRDAGALTDDEFGAKKAELLSRL